MDLKSTPAQQQLEINETLRSLITSHRSQPGVDAWKNIQALITDMCDFSDKFIVRHLPTTSPPVWSQEVGPGVSSEIPDFLLKRPDET